MFLYKTFLDAQVKRKYDAEMRYEEQAYEALKRAEKTGVAKALSNARSALAKYGVSVEGGFQAGTSVLGAQ
jgi:hypothetical protein